MGLRPTLVEFRNPKNKFHYHQGKNHKEPYVHYILDEDERIAAWALSFDYYGEPWCYFYVRKKYRRNHLGTRLLKRAAKHTWDLYEKHMCVGPHDKSSLGFFSRLKEKVEESGQPWGISLRYIWGMENE
jgi:GNAT superfamily N-acetyltransferase